MSESNNLPIAPIPDWLVERLAKANSPAAMKQLQVCKLCGVPAETIGIFVADEAFSRRIGAPKGKTRMVAYGLCVECLEHPDAADRVEDLILKECQVQ